MHKFDVRDPVSSDGVVDANAERPAHFRLARRASFLAETGFVRGEVTKGVREAYRCDRRAAVA
jgi:hypothetical protein